MVQYTSFCGVGANEEGGVLIAVRPMSIGIKQNGIIMALQAANSIDFAGYSGKFSFGMVSGSRRKGIVRVETRY
jgi:hypothetical protein